MRCQLDNSVVIFSHRFLDSDCINFKTFAVLAVYWPFWTSLYCYSTDIKVQQFFKSFLHDVKTMSLTSDLNSACISINKRKTFYQGYFIVIGILKTLLNIVEARLKKRNCWTLMSGMYECCSDWSINSQEYTKVLMQSLYQEIYDLISPIYKLSGLYGLFYNTAFYGGNEIGKSGHLSIFNLLKHLMMILKHDFFSSSQASF